MSDTAAPFHYDIVGSFLRPEKLKTARAQFAEGAISHDVLEAVENEAIKELVAQQKAAGLPPFNVAFGLPYRASWLRRGRGKALVGSLQGPSAEIEDRRHYRQG